MHLSIVAFVLLCGATNEAAKILMMMPKETKSHNYIHEATARALGAKGHQVTFFSPYPMSQPWPNVEWHEIEKTPPEEVEPYDLLEVTQTTYTVQLLYSFKFFFFDALERFYKHPKVKNIIEEVKTKGKIYDVAIVDTFLNDFVLPFASIAAKHTVMLSVTPIPSWIAHDLRIPYSTASLPSFYSTYSTPTDFWQRLDSTFEYYSLILFRKFYFIPEMQKIVNQHLPSSSPSIEDAIKDVSFILVNQDAIMASPRPVAPFVAYIGGIHLKKAKPLPKDLEDFMQSSGDHGVVLFSFGSFVDTKLMPKTMVDAFSNTFTKIKQNVIWKFHKQIEGIPKRIKIVSWMPQTDILAHPKLRLFITHGGRLSSQESVYHGVPVVAIGVFADQMQNANRVKEVGFGLELSLLNITEENVYIAVTTLLKNSKYSKRAKEVSAIFRDTMNSPEDTVNYWIEYVIRHNGAAHLKNQMEQDLHLVQYWLLDVWAVVVIVLALVSFILIKIFKLLSRIIFQTSKKQKIN